MWTLKVNAAKPMKKARFGKLMELLIDVLTHRGLMAGGGWNVADRTAELHCEAHKVSCCAKFPTVHAIKAGNRGYIFDWCDEHDLIANWKRG